MIGQQTTCDVCGAPKRETNHWLVARIRGCNPTGFALLPIDEPYASEKINGLETKHLCGHACAHKLLSQWLESLSSSTPER